MLYQLSYTRTVGAYCSIASHSFARLRNGKGLRDFGRCGALPLVLAPRRTDLRGFVPQLLGF